MDTTRTRLKDIAAETGVSVATVSRALGNKEGVSEQTRQRVRSAAELLGYEAPVGRRPPRPDPVAIIVPELDNPIFGRFVQDLLSALAGHDYTCVACVLSPVTTEDHYLDVLLGRGVAGLVFVCGRHANTEVDHTRYAALAADGIPMVLVNGFMAGLDASFISTNDGEAMALAVSHLRQLGHRRIGCAIGPRRYVHSQRKLDGFRRAVASGRAGARDPGSPGGPAGKPRDDTAAAVAEDLVAHAIYSIEGGQDAANVLLERGATAIACGSDLMALGAVRAIRDQGLDVPGDVSVVGYDDSPLMAFTDPPLTTVRQDVRAMCRHAVDTLLDEIAGRGGARREVLFRPELVVRGSTGPASR